MNLFEIDRRILNGFDDETGEIFDEAAIDALNMTKNEKIDNIGCFIKNLNAEIAALKEEENAFRKRRQSKEHQVEGLKKYLTAVLNGKTFETTRTRISFKASHAVEVPDITQLDIRYCVYGDPKPDKTAIKKDILAGKIINGAQLVDGINIQIK